MPDSLLPRISSSTILPVILLSSSLLSFPTRCTDSPLGSDDLALRAPLHLEEELSPEQVKASQISCQPANWLLVKGAESASWTDGGEDAAVARAADEVEPVEGAGQTPLLPHYLGGPPSPPHQLTATPPPSS